MPDQRRVYQDLDTLWADWKRCQSDSQRARELEDAAIRQLLAHQEKQDRPERALDTTGWMRSILLERAGQTLALEHSAGGRSSPTG